MSCFVADLETLGYKAIPIVGKTAVEDVRSRLLAALNDIEQLRDFIYACTRSQQ
jgi:hypothetical protein